tara:strand:+ start:22 stop:300 length:279 start_codon:yes stop_codon:yes gene_type:complete
MSNYDKNLQRALAILATHPDETDISFCSIRVSVAGQRLCPQDEDDREVLSILMASKEFGFAVSAIEVMAEELRKMQRSYDGPVELLKQMVAA